MPHPKPISPNRSPSFSLPLRYFLLGIACFTLSLAGLAVWGPEVLATAWSPHLLGLTHLLTLGWMLAMIMGATYQFVPVVLHTGIACEGLAKGAFWLYAAGMSAMVSGFWRHERLWLIPGATMLVLAIALYLANLGLSLWRSEAWNLQGTYLTTALGFLMLAAGIGWLRAWSLSDPNSWLALSNGRTAHVQLATMGFVSLLIFGISYRLVPMFTTVHGRSRGDTAVLIATSAGVLALASGTLCHLSALAQFGAITTAGGMGLWGSDMIRIHGGMKASKRDPGLSYGASAVGYLFVALAMGLALALGRLPPGVDLDRWTIAYGVTGLIGWISFAIIGQFHRIMPFIVWYHRYSKMAGKKSPLLKDLSDERIGWAGFWAAQCGLWVLVAAILTGQAVGIRAGAGLLLLSAVGTATMMVQTLIR